MNLTPEQLFESMTLAELEAEYFLLIVESQLEIMCFGKPGNFSILCDVAYRELLKRELRDREAEMSFAE